MQKRLEPWWDLDFYVYRSFEHLLNSHPECCVSTNSTTSACLYTITNYEVSQLFAFQERPTPWPLVRKC